jgi:hypothetical protein
VSGPFQANKKKRAIHSRFVSGCRSPIDALNSRMVDRNPCNSSDNSSYFTLSETGVRLLFVNFTSGRNPWYRNWAAYSNDGDEMRSQHRSITFVSSVTICFLICLRFETSSDSSRFVSPSKCNASCNRAISLVRSANVTSARTLVVRRRPLCLHLHLR